MTKDLILDEFFEESKPQTIEEIAAQAAEVLMFEDKATLPMIEISIAAKDGPYSATYSIRLPKAFVERIYQIGESKGYDKGWQTGYDEGLYDAENK
jgi:hypothetical protein